MCLRSKHAITLLLVVTAMFAVFTPALHADDVADFLQRHGLNNLLTAHLEQQIDEAGNAEARGELVLRLAGLYAQLLESENDVARRQDLEVRSRRLLEMAPADSAEELRLALLRTSYRAAERTAENHRLRLVSPEEVESAKKTLAEIIPQLTSLRQRLRHGLEQVDRRLSRASGADAVLLSDSGEQARVLFAQCTFLNAWALYYDSWLNGGNENARLAEVLFAELLASDTPSPQPSDVSVDLRSTEAIARSILGMALCKSISASTATAISWIHLLEHENTFAPLRAQVPGWRIAIHLEHREYQQVRDLLQSQSAPNEMQLAWLRLIAVHALEDSQRTRHADELARFAVLELAARGELQQVLDLATRYGADSLGQSGFALQYVHGVIKYQQARAAHGSDAPTLDQEITAMYSQAANQFADAISQPDAANYPAPAAACKRMIAWCHYFRGRFLDARHAFEEAAQQLDNDEAAEALWMAIVSLDKVAQAGDDKHVQAQLDELMGQFLNRYPESEHAPKLQMRKALAAEEVSESAIEELLAIPPGSDVYDSARRLAVDMMYQRFRSTGGNERYFHANRFLSAAVPLLSEASLAVDLNESHGAERYIVRCRQVLEVSLADGIDRAAAARSALDALESLRTIEDIDLSSVADEVDCRHVQERLLEGDVDAAAAIADELWARDPSSTWTRIATRAMFKYGHAQWKRASTTVTENQNGLELVVRYGGRVLHEFKDADDALSQPGALGYHVAVAEASMTLWEQSGEVERGRAALYLFEKLLASRPRNAAFLRSIAILAEKLGDHSRSLDCWRRLASGTQANTEPWYEAKFHLIRLLTQSDPNRARDVMNQHKQLNPDYGPDPWGAKLKGLDQLISTHTPTTTPTAPDAEQTSGADGPEQELPNSP